MFGNIFKLTKGLFSHQWKILKNVVSIENIRLVGIRIKVYLKGDFPIDQKLINGEVFAVAAMGYLISGHYEKLQGQLGDIFIDAIRYSWCDKFDGHTRSGEIA